MLPSRHLLGCTMSTTVYKFYTQQSVQIWSGSTRNFQFTSDQTATTENCCDKLNWQRAKDLIPRKLLLTVTSSSIQTKYKISNGQIPFLKVRTMVPIWVLGNMNVKKLNIIFIHLSRFTGRLNDGYWFLLFMCRNIQIKTTTTKWVFIH